MVQTEAKLDEYLLNGFPVLVVYGLMKGKKFELCMVLLEFDSHLTFWERTKQNKKVKG